MHAGLRTPARSVNLTRDLFGNPHPIQSGRNIGDSRTLRRTSPSLRCSGRNKIWSMIMTTSGAITIPLLARPEVRSPHGGPKKKALDPRDPLQKKRFKASITDAIAKEIDGSDRIDIATRVDDLYERLLLKAVIFEHIPSLTAGMVRRDVSALKASHHYVA